MDGVSISGWAALAVSVFWALLVGFVCYALVSLFRLLTATRDLLEDFRRETVPMLGQLNETVAGLNREIGQVDEILENVKGTTSAVHGITKTAQAAVAHPAIRALAVAAGAARAYQRFPVQRARLMVKRLRWMVVGGVLAMTLYLWLSARIRARLPARLAAEAGRASRDLRERLRSAWREGRDEMSRREEELRRELATR